MDPGGTLHVIGHDPDPDTVLTLTGTFASWAQERGLAVRPFAMRGDGPHEPFGDPAAPAAVVVLGSREGAWDDGVPWLAAEIAYLRAAIAAGTPVLGFCFGGQLLARVLGGTAHPAAGLRENGWHTISTTEPEVIVPGPWMEFHFDTFTAPPDAEVLATTPRCQQAFRLGRHLGVQFHPEVTPAEVETWIASWTGTPIEERFTELGIHAEDLRRETAQRAEESRVASWRLFDDFAARAGLLAEVTGVPAR